MSRRSALAIVVAAAVLPRLLVIAIEREDLLAGLTEKSDRFARTLVASGTFGFLPGRPSAYTQPAYGLFLSGIYRVAGRDWLWVGLAQTALATATAVLVFLIASRVASRGVAVLAAVLATIHPYLVWHDLHVNREVLDGTLAAALVLTTLIAAQRRTLWWSVLAGGVAGLAVLGNSRLLLLPLVLAVFVAWDVRPGGRALLTGMALLAASALVISPWVVRNKVSVGCFAITTDARALWKANNMSTRQILAQGKWIDDVPNLPDAPPWPELAADLTLSGKKTTVDECTQMRFYTREVRTFWREHPGEKSLLAAQAVQMLWSPVVSVESDEPQAGIGGLVRTVVEPAFVLALYVLAVAGLFLLPRRYLVLTLALLAYNTLAAMVFAGTVRYRVPWDFVLCVPAAIAIARGMAMLRARRGEAVA